MADRNQWIKHAWVSWPSNKIKQTQMNKAHRFYVTKNNSIKLYVSYVKWMIGIAKSKRLLIDIVFHIWLTF